MRTEKSLIFRLWRNAKIQILAILVVSAALGLARQPQPMAALTQLLLAVGAALLAEWAFFGCVSSSSLQSAAITGMLVGMLLAPGVSPILVWFAAVAAIGSKKLMQFKPGKHIFNPASFGLILTAAILGNQINWWGYASPVLVIVAVGAVLFRLNRLSLPFAYFLSRGFSVLLLAGMGVKAFLLPNLFFAFVMLVEPKTSPGKRPAQVLFGGLAGVFATAMYAFAPGVDGDLLALLCLNLLRPLIEKAMSGRKA